ncbi:hypothetical protein [Streptomyces californicus]|uniref:hypothetical protein n=1 Tax=Streptomyces californicus TaxID=67351 RepID=UPI0036467D67
MGEHAWCLTGDGHVADPALPDGYAALYRGLPPAEAFRAEHHHMRDDDAVLTFGHAPLRAALKRGAAHQTAQQHTGTGPGRYRTDLPGGLTMLATAEHIHPEGPLGPVKVIWHRPADAAACDGDCDYPPLPAATQASACPAACATYPTPSPSQGSAGAPPADPT